MQQKQLRLGEILLTAGVVSAVFLVGYVTHKILMRGINRWMRAVGVTRPVVWTFLPTPLATATAMYHTGKNPLRKVTNS